MLEEGTNFYLVKYRQPYDTDKGVKFMRMQWLIEATSVTEVESILLETEKDLHGVSIDIIIDSVTKTKIENVIQS